MIKFFEKFPDESSCIEGVKNKRLEMGIVCKKCQHTEHSFRKTDLKFQCKKCGSRLSLRSGTVMENSNQLCSLAIRVCGGHSLLKSFPLERLYRDSRCGGLMRPWGSDRCLEKLGMETLYESQETDEQG